MSKLNFDLATNADEDFFGSLERSRTNLGQLFGIDAKHEDENHTLKYQPTKVKPIPPTSVATAAPQQSWNTHLAKVANAYKNGESIGKVGVALLKNIEGACKIIIYKTKTQVLSTLTLNMEDNNEQLHKKSQYWQFYDDDKIYWSLLFDKKDDEQELERKLKDFNIQVKEANEPPRELNDSTDGKQTVIISTKVTEVHENESTVDGALNLPREVHSKSSLLSRVAKVGLPLPKLTAATQQMTSTECSDSSDTEVIATPINVVNKPTIIPRNNKMPIKTHVASTSMGVYNSAATAAMNPMETQFLQMLLTENRTQNTEMRMNLNRLDGRIEKILDKIELFGNASVNQRPNKDDEILELEEKLLQIKKENRKLTQLLQQTEKPSSIEKTPKNILESVKEDLVKLDVNADEDLECFVFDLINKGIALQGMLAKNEYKIEEYRQQSQKEKLQLKEIEEDRRKNIVKIEELEETAKILNSDIQAQRDEITNLKAKLLEESDKAAQQASIRKSDTENTVKAIMNNLYGNITTKLDNEVDDHLTKDVILQLIGRTIKEETLKAIQQIVQ